MTTLRAAFYARVSGEQQAAAHTIESQIREAFINEEQRPYLQRQMQVQAEVA